MVVVAVVFASPWCLMDLKLSLQTFIELSFIGSANVEPGLFNLTWQKNSWWHGRKSCALKEIIMSHIRNRVLLRWKNGYLFMGKLFSQKYGWIVWGTNINATPNEYRIIAFWKLSESFFPGFRKNIRLDY